MLIILHESLCIAYLEAWVDWDELILLGVVLGDKKLWYKHNKAKFSLHEDRKLSIPRQQGVQKC